MFPAGALFKYLATVTAFLTVLAGGPRVRCVCPDGRVQFLCPDSFASGCCCNPSAADSAGAAPSPGQRDPHSCCARVRSGASADQTRAVERCGCQRALVADAAYTAEEASDGDRFEAGSTAWAGRPIVTTQTSRFDRVERRFLLPPSDRVILFCHFTC